MASNPIPEEDAALLATVTSEYDCVVLATMGQRLVAQAGGSKEQARNYRTLLRADRFAVAYRRQGAGWAVIP